jgi:predicted amidophosphoribosyltransferase
MNEREQIKRMSQTMDEITEKMDYGNFVTESMKREPEPRCDRCQSPGKFRGGRCSGCIAETQDRQQAIAAAQEISCWAANILTTHYLPDDQMRRLVSIRRTAGDIQAILSD